MSHVHSSGLVLTLLIAALAGCIVGGGTEDAELSDVGTIEGSGGGLRGIVVSDELFPVAEARITVVDGAETFTDSEGRFLLLDLAPGMVTLNVTAEGYEPALQNAEVPSEGIAEVRILLTGIPGQSPYYTIIPFDGFEVCSFSIVYSAGPYSPPFPCAFGTRVGLLTVEVGRDWRAGVHEMVWETSEEMIFSSSLENSCTTSGSAHSKCPSLIWGPSPLRVVARPLDADYAALYAIDGAEMWPEGNHTSFLFEGYSGYLRGEINSTFYPVCVIINNQFNVPEHWGCPFGVGTSIGIRFQFYHTTFYFQEPLDLEGFTALPDA